MTHDGDTARHLAEALHQEEKTFLMGQYASLLVQDLEQEGRPVVDRRVIQALRTARPYAGAALSARIDRLLTGGTEPFRAAPDAEADLDEDHEPEEEEEEGLFDADEEEDEVAAESAADDDDLEAEETGLFDEDEEVKTPVADRDQEELDEEEDTLGFSGTEGHSTQPTPGFVPTKGHEQEDTPGFVPTQGHQPKDTPGFLPKQGHERQETPGFSPKEDVEDEETPGFAGTEGHQTRPTPGFIPTKGHEQEETPGFVPKQGHQRQETPGFVPKEEADKEDDRGFVPTQGHQRKDTPGFVPRQGHERQETPGFVPKEEAEDEEETPGFTPHRGHESRSRVRSPRKEHPPGEEEGEEPRAAGRGSRQQRPSRERPRPRGGADADDAGEPGIGDPEKALFEEDEEVKEQDEEQGTTGAGPEKKRTRGRRQPGASPAADRPQKPARSGRARSAAIDPETNARERASKARDELERRRLAREAERQQRTQRLAQRPLFPGQAEAGQHDESPPDQTERRHPTREEESPDPEADQAEAVEIDELLSGLTYSVSLEDLERYFDIKIPTEDRLQLDRRYALKTRETTVRSLLHQMRTSGTNYALIPRLSRLVHQGQELRITAASLLRAQPQLFENVQQIIVKYRAESCFVKDSPGVDWAIVACEALPESLGRNFAQQRQIVKQYAQGYQATERRISRRRLVEALYDLIVVQLVHKEGMLSRTVDLTDSKVGRQNLVFINYGTNGIRISDISRLEAHPQLGICPSW
ncbi:MAG: hypothetical protein WDA75_22155 [Candidatus Latescibacterota bacterium]|jgi:hypothetical protein